MKENIFRISLLRSVRGGDLLRFTLAAKQAKGNAAFRMTLMHDVQDRSSNTRSWVG
ncbi:hypothetical protein ABT120_53130 [Nonomuraea angiospora]|uniref:hypothetical protein n=1 Tax=Nonomuraea angiospora TaxID=46172 RepID=UPI00332C5E42